MERYYRAETVADACERLAGPGDPEPIAGGQTLTLHIRQGLKDPGCLVDISGIDDLTDIVADDDHVRIGSAVTYDALGRSSVVREEFPFFADAIGHIAGPQVRANGTIGGGLCYGDPALDAPPVLLALDADLVLHRRGGQRTLPLAEFFVGFYETAKEPDELLTEIVVPKLPADSHGVYRTMAPRQGDYAVAGVAVRGTFDGGTCRTARVALTNGGEVPKRVPDAEAALEDTAFDDPSIDDAVGHVRRSLDIIGDQQIPRSYQETVFVRLARQAFRDVRTRRAADDGTGADR